MMKDFFYFLIAGLRLSFLLKPFKQPRIANTTTVIALLLVSAAIVLVGQWAVTAAPKVFYSNGLQTFATECLLMLISGWVLARTCGREVMFPSITGILMLTYSLTSTLWWMIILWRWRNSDVYNPTLMKYFYNGFALWWGLILIRQASYLGTLNPIRFVYGILLTCSITFLPWSGFTAILNWQNGLYRQPLWITVREETTEFAEVNQTTFDPEKVIYAQPRMMQDTIDQLTPETSGKVDLYLIAFGGDGEEDVFRNEVEFVEQQFQQRFDAKGHTVVLVNNPSTIEQRPLASLTNLQMALDAVGKKMNRDEDILMLFLTSHGSKNHRLHISLDPLPLNQIEPEDLAEALKNSLIRWRVLVISACYSGGFIGALKSSTTLVITAARSDRTSFGCGANSDITYFGKAFFTEALNQTDSFTTAFNRAEDLIAEWEERNQQEHSYPQMASTPLIEEKLGAWRNGVKLGPSILFKPIAKTSSENAANDSTNEQFERNPAQHD